MPFTPFHFGPGFLFKSIGPASFSLSAFVATQVLIDFETLYFLSQRVWPVHRFLHSIPGSLLAGFVVAGVALVSRRWLGLRFPASFVRDDLGTLSITLGSVVGGLSHALLDNVMHDDSRLWYPSEAGPHLQGVVGLGELHLGCVVSGIVGLVVLALRLRLNDRGHR